MAGDSAAYVEGRLAGLSELIKILKDLIQGEEKPDLNGIVKTIVLHISSEMDEIITELAKEHGERALGRASEKLEELKGVESERKPDLAAHMENADDLMKDLMGLKKKS